jgi:serine/threonine-protein kinase
MDRETFLGHLLQSGLLSPEQLAALSPHLPDTPRGRLVARDLVQRGLLTKFQAEMLLAGRTAGFQLGQYRILTPLGQGGMGRVFKAVHLTMNRIVALKLVAPACVKTEQGRLMFQREVRAAARLLHPNIVTAFDAGQAGDRSYLIMEFVDGPNLEQLVREQGPLEIGQACDLIRQAARGLQYAFELGMVHRDIKPANLLIHRPGGAYPESPGVVKILDFGLARFHDPTALPGGGSILIRENTILGTPDFVSPEQARDVHGVDIRSDLYSLGCTFYYLLTGQVPYPGGSAVEKLVRHGTVAAPAVEELRPGVPAAVSTIVRQLMAKAPADRFQTPAELAAALTPFAVAGWPRGLMASATSTGEMALSAAASNTPRNSEPPAEAVEAHGESVLEGPFPWMGARTPLITSEWSARQRQRLERERQRRRLRLTILWAIGLVAGVLGLVGLLAILR